MPRPNPNPNTNPDPNPNTNPNQVHFAAALAAMRGCNTSLADDPTQLLRLTPSELASLSTLKLAVVCTLATRLAAPA